MHSQHDRMGKSTKTARVVVAVLALGLPTLIGSCGVPADRAETPEGDAPGLDTSLSAAGVRIAAPSAGEVVEGPEVLVVLEVEGLVIVPAGVEQEASGHHHLVVDAPLPEPGVPIPSEPGRYIHLGKGQTEFRLEGLEVGEHQVIALVGDYAHVPLNPPVADTVRFIVR